MQINQILKEHSLIPLGYEIRGNVSIIKTNKGKVVYKPASINKEIINYLKTRNFDYLPPVIVNDDEYQITEYQENLDIPNDQKIQDMVNLVALLHSKTTHYKEIDVEYYESLYEDIENNINYLYEYYTDLITLIESKVYMSPSEYLLARNINVIYEAIDRAEERLTHWHALTKEKRKQRNVVLHNNLKLEHFIRNENSYLISWDKAKIGSPVFDIYKLYKKHILDFDFVELLKVYENHYPLLEDEKELLFTLITLPDIVTFKGTQYKVTKRVSQIIDVIYKTKEFTKTT